MKLTKLTFLLLMACLMAPIAFGQLKNEKRNTPKPAPPPIIPGQKKPRQDPDTTKAKMPDQNNDGQADETTPRPATSGSKKRNAIPNEIGSGR